MKKYSRIFGYLKPYKGKIVLYFLFILLSIIFSIVSIGMLMPFLQLIFTNPDPQCVACSPLSKGSSNAAIQFINNWLMQSIASKGKLSTLGIICVLMMLFIILKKSFFIPFVLYFKPVKEQGSK